MKKILNARKLKMLFRQTRTQKTLGLFALLILTSLLYVQCSKESVIPSVEGMNVNVMALTGSLPILRMSYDSEVSTYMTMNGDLTNTMDIAAQTPIIEKNNILLEISENGEVVLQMIKRTPSQSVEIPHLTLPEDSPEPHKTVIGGGKIQIFDDQNVLLHSENYDLPNAEQIVTLLQDLGGDYTSSAINEMLSMGQSSLFVSDLEAYLQQATNNGITVNHLNNDFVTLSEPIDKQNPSSDISVSLINKTNNQVVENRLYDTGNKWKSSIQFRYHDGESPILKATLERTKTVLPSGLDATMETYSTFENLTYEVNL